MTSSKGPVNLRSQEGVAIIAIDFPPVNALAKSVRAGLRECLSEAMASEAVAIVLTSSGRLFSAGFDIGEFGSPQGGVTLDEICKQIDDSPKPVIAAINGAALGGGLELALCAHARVAAEAATFGLPEVKLGLVPGGGGTQRLPRLCGVRAALSIITSGRPIGADEAAQLGLVNKVVSASELMAQAISVALDLAGTPGAFPRASCMEDGLAEAKQDPEFFAKFRKANARKARGNPAFEKAIACVEAATTASSFEQGLRFEKSAFAELLTSPASKAQRYVFFAERQAAKVPDVPADTAMRPIMKVGVIGAGTMGGGIAMCFADNGMPVTIVEASAEALDRGIGVIQKNYERSAVKGRITDEDVAQRMGLVTPSLEMSALADCDLIVEAVFEDFEVKRSVFEKLDDICKQGAILATNTSAIDVNKIAATTSRPEDIIGLHFFSPANVMRLLEVVRGDKTGRDVIATAMKLGRDLKKVAVLSGSCHGFIANRMLKLRQMQSQLLLLEGTMPWEIDRVLMEFGFPMGPFAMSDLVGLDLGWVKEKSTGETLREVFCEHGRRGQKTGAGYYDYDDQRNRLPSAQAEQLIKAFVSRKGGTVRSVEDEEIFARCIFPVINEGTKILEEKIALRASDIDVAWVNGFAWPATHGGPMYHADQIGLSYVVDTLRRFNAETDSIAPPSQLLLHLEREGLKLSEVGRD